MRTGVSYFVNEIIKYLDNLKIDNEARRENDRLEIQMWRLLSSVSRCIIYNKQFNGMCS